MNPDTVYRQLLDRLADELQRREGYFVVILDREIERDCKC